jgi:hypothetical protein
MDDWETMRLMEPALSRLAGSGEGPGFKVGEKATGGSEK